MVRRVTMAVRVPLVTGKTFGGSMSATPKSLLAPALIVFLAVTTSACQATPASGQTATPTATIARQAVGTVAPASDTPVVTSRQAASTATPILGDPNNPRDKVSTTNACDPCMIMRLSTQTPAGRPAQAIAGEVTARGKEGTIEVLAYQHDVKVPRDSGSGLATGRRQYQPIRITKLVDKATPLLAKALADNTPLTARIEFYRPKADGTQEQYYTIELQNVLVSSISVFGFDPQVLAAAGSARSFVIPHVLEATGAAVGNRTVQQEEISLNFTKITWTYEPGKISAEDTWSGQ